jgi:hypothetical protein
MAQVSDVADSTGQQVERDRGDAGDECLAAALGRGERDDGDEQHRGGPEVAGRRSAGDGRDVEDGQHEPGEVDHQPLARASGGDTAREGGDRLGGEELDADRDETPDVARGRRRRRSSAT